MEHEGGALVRRVALTTAIIAALAAVAALLAGSTVNEALVLKNESTRLQAEASDQWAYYQAQGIKGALQDAIAAAWLAAGRAARARRRCGAEAARSRCRARSPRRRNGPRPRAPCRRR